MTRSKITPPPGVTVRAASQLTPGDRIADGFLPDGDPADVLFAYLYGPDSDRWVIVTYRFDDGRADADHFRADGGIWLESIADASGLGYSREADDPTPVSPARVPLHTGSIVRDSELVIDPTPTGPSLVPAPIAAHFETRGWKGEGPGSCGVECACGIGYGGFDSLTEAGAVLDTHIAEANAAPLVHYRFGMHDTACGLKPGEVPAATADHAKVTCKACIAAPDRT